jgi:hypothetical protein
MPTVLLMEGWRLCFYRNQGDEPMHVHAMKGNTECKFWLHPDQFVIEEDFEHNLTDTRRSEVRRIIYRHFDEICESWKDQYGAFRGR